MVGRGLGRGVGEGGGLVKEGGPCIKDRAPIDDGRNKKYELGQWGPRAHPNSSRFLLFLLLNGMVHDHGEKNKK